MTDRNNLDSNSSTLLAGSQPQLPPIDPRMLAAMYGMQEEDEIDLLEYWRIIWKRKIMIIAVTFIAALLAAGYSLTLPNIYKAEVLLAPVSAGGSKGGGLASALGGLGGLASMAGISLPGGGDTEQNLAVLKTREFLWSFIKDQKLMPILFEDDWDAEKGTWEKADPEEQPTLWDAYRMFTKGRLLAVSTEKDSGLVTVAVEWKDADLAAEWANALVLRLNDYLRQRAIADGKSNLEYLNRELARTQVEDIRKALFGMISTEQKKVMLANTQVQYAFRVLDRAQAPDRKSKPKRALIVVLSVFVVGFLCVIFVFIQEGIRQRKLTEAEEMC